MSAVELTFSFDDGKSQSFTLSGKNTLVIGRSSECDVVLPYEGFSRKHCRVEIENGDIYITDLKSANGIYVGGDRLETETKTLYQSFLSLQIGPATSVTINLQTNEPVPVERKSPAVAPSSANRESTRAIKRPTVSEHTKTHVLKKPMSKRANKVDSENNKFKSLVFVVLLGIGGVYYYFQQQEEAAVVDNQQQEAAAEAPKAPPIETKFLPSERVMNLAGQQNCEGATEKEWCGHLGLRPEVQEGIVVKDDSLLSFINTTEIKKHTTQEQFLQLKRSEQYELLLLRKIIQSVVLVQLKRSQFTNIQFIALEENLPAYSLKINRDFDDTVLKRALVYPIIDEGMNQGKVDNLSMIRSTYQTTFLP